MPVDTFTTATVEPAKIRACACSIQLQHVSSRLNNLTVFVHLCSICKLFVNYLVQNLCLQHLHHWLTTNYIGHCQLTTITWISPNLCSPTLLLLVVWQKSQHKNICPSTLLVTQHTCGQSMPTLQSFQLSLNGPRHSCEVLSAGPLFCLSLSVMYVLVHTCALKYTICMLHVDKNTWTIVYCVLCIVFCV